MYPKKIFLFLILLSLMLILFAGVTNALNWGFSGGADPEKGIVIEGIEFNIPDGYEKNNSKSIVNETNSSENNSFVLNQETYENTKGEEIIISIVDYDDFDVDSKMLSKVCEGSNQKTLMGYPGYINGNDNYTQFVYAFDHRLVSITASNEDIINHILVVEDA